MNAKLLSRALCLGMAAAFALSFAATAVAQQALEAVHVKATPTADPIALLSEASGLTERQVEMVLGYRSAYAGYDASYPFAARRLEKAVGPEIYQHLKSRHELSAQDVQSLTAMIDANNGVSVAAK
ncbi:MAG: hypothetical protein ACRD27_07835 [Terracidiphilus sp.]